MASLANAAAALPTGPGGGSISRCFPQGSPRASPRVRFDTGLVRFECKDANIKNGGKANMAAHVRQMLAIVQRADESAVILPIDMDRATPISRIEKAEAIKDADDVRRYLKDVSHGCVRGSKGASGVRFTMRVRLQKTVKAIKWDDKVSPTLKKMGVWMETRTTQSTDPVKVGFLIVHPNFTNQVAFVTILLRHHKLRMPDDVSLTMCCDNESAVNTVSVQEFARGVKAHAAAEFDVIFEIRHLLSVNDVTIAAKHVKGHQDNDCTYT